MELQAVTAQMVAERELDALTEGQYLRTQRRFDLFLGRRSKVEDLHPTLVNKFLKWAKSQFSLSNTSVRNHRRSICRIWNYAAEIRVCDGYDRRRIYQPKEEDAAVFAWTIDQFRLLIQAAGDLPGQLRSGVPASVFLTAWLWVGYDTGMRPRDMRKLTWDAVDFQECTVAFIQHKTKRHHTSLVGDSSVNALRLLRSYGTRKVFHLGKSGVRRWELILFSAAEQIGFSRRKRQALGTLRKTHATEVYREHNLSTAAESLGHTSGTRTAAKHYIDHRYKNRGTLPPSPPPVDSGENEICG